MGPPYGITMIVDATITVGNIIEICTIAGGGILALATMRTKISNLTQRFESIQLDFSDMKKDIKAIGDVKVEMAIINQRLLGTEQDVRELKHGRGFVQEEIRGEWPRT